MGLRGRDDVALATARFKPAFTSQRLVHRTLLDGERRKRV
jgi:hypothetical protein